MSDVEPSKPPRPPFQFGLGTLFLVTAMCSVLAAALAGMLRSRFYTSMPPGFFELMAAAAPMAMLIVVSLIRSAVQLLKGRRR